MKIGTTKIHQKLKHTHTQTFLKLQEDAENTHEQLNTALYEIFVFSYMCLQAIDYT